MVRLLALLALAVSCVGCSACGGPGCGGGLLGCFGGGGCGCAATNAAAAAKISTPAATAVAIAAVATRMLRQRLLRQRLLRRLRLRAGLRLQQQSVRWRWLLRRQWLPQPVPRLPALPGSLLLVPSPRLQRLLRPMQPVRRLQRVRPVRRRLRLQRVPEQLRTVPRLLLRLLRPCCETYSGCCCQTQGPGCCASGDHQYNFNPGPPIGQVAYPYYTVRGPRDFLQANPPSIGPY